MNSRFPILSAMIAALGLSFVAPVQAEEPVLPNSVATVPESTPPKPAEHRNTKRKVKEVTPEQEQRILAFVGTHHPELSTLLQRLRDKDSQQYQVALQDLRGTVERLTRLQQKNPKRYEAEVENWKAQSHIRLLRARRALQPDGVSETELRGWLEKEVDSRLQLLKLNRTEQAARLAQLDEQIRLTEENRNKDVDQELKRAMKKTRARPTSPRSKPATRRKGPAPAEPELGQPD